MQVSMTPIAVTTEEDAEGNILGYRVIMHIDDDAAARAIGCRIQRELLFDIPDAQPPDVYEISVPEEEAEVNQPKGRRGGGVKRRP